MDKYVNEKEERVYHKYYQWVYFVLFFQAACFYAPHFLWKIWESKLLTILTVKFRNPLFKEKEPNEEEKEGKEPSPLDLVVDYLTKNHPRHQTYFYYFTLCEIFNFINVIMQIYLVDEFLGGTFTTYGLEVLNYVQLNQVDRVDPMVRVFPRMTKCSFHRFGSSGDVQKYDALCILPLNIINEKIYIVMWFWFVFLAVITGLWLCYRVLTLSQSKMRFYVLKRRASLANTVELRYVLDRLEVGDWFILSMMCKNMDSQWFRLVIRDLCKKMRDREKELRKARSSNARMKTRLLNGKEREPSEDLESTHIFDEEESQN